MGYLENYTNRVQGSISESLSNSASHLIDATFADSPYYRLISIEKTNNETVSDVETRTVKGDSSLEMEFLFKSGEKYSIGDTAIVGSDKWLFVDFLKDDIFPKAEAELCNNTLSIVTETPGEIVGYDNLGRPVYGDPTTTTTDIPCVVKSIKEMYNGDDEQINLVSGSIALMVPSNKSDILKRGIKFQMFNNTYEIYGFDYSKTINNEGLVIVLANKI